LREQHALGALGDRFVRVRRQHREKFRAILRGERGAAGANRQLSFRARMAGADFCAQFGANGVLPRRA
jgi:hypothetical protein